MVYLLRERRKKKKNINMIMSLYHKLESVRHHYEIVFIYIGTTLLMEIKHKHK